MTEYCIKCKIEFAAGNKNRKCPVCGSKLQKIYTKEELEEIRKQNDEITVINSMLMM